MPTQGTERKTSEELALYELPDLSNLSYESLDILQKRLKLEKIKRSLQENRPKELEVVIKEVEYDEDYEVTRLTFEGLEPLTISDYVSTNLIHAGGALVQYRKLDIGKFDGTWTLNPSLEIDEADQGGDAEDLAEILDVFNPEKKVPYTTVLKWLLEAVNDGDLAGEDEIMEWVQANLDDEETWDAYCK